MVQINLQMAIIILIIVHMMGVVINIVYQLEYKDNSKIFSIARICDIFSGLSLALRGVMNAHVAIYATNSLLLIGAFLKIVYILKVKGCYTKKIKIIYRISIILILIGNAFLTKYLASFHNERSIILYLGILIMWLYPNYILIKKDSSIIQKVIASVYILGYTVNLMTAIIGIVAYKKQIVIAGNNYNLMIYVIYYITLVTGNMSILSFIKEINQVRLLHDAYYDELTDLINRRCFYQKSEDMLIKMYNDKSPITFLSLDIDDFKVINDTYGHHVGDKVLVDFAQRVGRVIHEPNLFGRFGGEEFVIFLQNTDEYEGMKTAKNIQTIVGESKVESSITYTISIGMLTFTPQKHTSFNELYRVADRLLYQAKNRGKNCIIVGEYNSNES